MITVLDFRDSSQLQRLISIAAFVLSFVCLVAPTRAGTQNALTLGGSGGALGTMQRMADEFRKSHPDVKITILPSLGSSGAIKAVLSGAIDIALSTRPLTDAERGQGAMGSPYARTAFVFAVSRNRPMSNITADELVRMYSGQTPFWKDGKPVRIILRPKGDSDTELIESVSAQMKQALAQAHTRPGMILAVTDQESADRIEQLPDALGTLTLAQILSENRAIKPLAFNGVTPSAGTLADGRYPYFKEMSFVTKGPPSGLAREFIAFLRSPAGHRILLRYEHVVSSP